MTPRRYDMSNRSKARDESRQRILDATIQLHTERGILGTSWRDIAERADVAVTTVYNHFPSLDELVPACGELLMQRLRPRLPPRMRRSSWGPAVPSRNGSNGSGERFSASTSAEVRTSTSSRGSVGSRRSRSGRPTSGRRSRRSSARRRRGRGHAPGDPARMRVLRPLDVQGAPRPRCRCPVGRVHHGPSGGVCARGRGPHPRKETVMHIDRGEGRCGGSGSEPTVENDSRGWASPRC